MGPQLITENKNIILSEGIQYHISNNIPLIENIYRPLSNKYFKLFQEAKDLYNKGIIHVNEYDLDLLGSDIGEMGIYNGVTVPLDCPLSIDEIINIIRENKDKKHPPLNKPKRGGSKKFYVYVKDPKTKKIKKVSFGDTTGLKAKINNPQARQAFSKRHDCPNKKDKTKASYWSCRLPRYAKLLGIKTTYSGYW